jgi:hypothetical protein
MNRIFTIVCLLSIYSLGFGQDLISYELRTTLTRGQILSQFGDVVPDPQYDIEIYRVLYTMDDTKGMLDTVSGALYLPVGDDSNEIFALVCDMHGTTDRTNVPSTNLSFTTALFAANGFVAIAPDFLGLGTSRGFHPYIHAETEGMSGVQMLRAIPPMVSALNIKLNEQLFITGYSQGGHAAMAMHRIIQNEFSAEFEVTAASPMSGPYSVSGIMFDKMMEDRDYLPGVGFLPYVVLGLQEAYGDLYEELSDVFKTLYVGPIRNFRNGNTTFSGMIQQLIALLASNTFSLRPRNMLRDDVLQTLLTEPESSRLFQVLEDQDLLDWIPEVPVRLFHCEADEQVPYTNSILAEEVFLEGNAIDVAANSVGANLFHVACATPASLATIEFFKSFATSSTQDVLAGTEYQIFPNPATDYLIVRNIETGQYDRVKAEIINMNGQLVRQNYTTNGMLNIADLQPAMYVLRLQSDKQVTVQSFVKI